MNRMYSKEELIALIQQYAPGFDPSEIETGTIAPDSIIGLDSDGDMVKGNLDGKYVKIIAPPESTTLTDAQIELFKNGIFINGTFLGLKNPQFFPCDTGYCGWVISNAAIYPYAFNDHTIVIRNWGRIILDPGDDAIETQAFKISNALKIFGKSFPSYPNDDVHTYTLKLVAGVLTWVQDV